MKRAIATVKMHVYGSYSRAQCKLQEQKGDFVMDHAVVIVITLVLGALALYLLKEYLGVDFANMMKDKINSMFN